MACIMKKMKIKLTNQTTRIIIIIKVQPKKDVFSSTNVRPWRSMTISTYSILGWASYCMNKCINVSWHCANQSAGLRRYNGSPGCFRSSALLGLVSLPIQREAESALQFPSSTKLWGIQFQALKWAYFLEDWRLFEKHPFFNWFYVIFNISEMLHFILSLPENHYYQNYRKENISMYV